MRSTIAAQQRVERRVAVAPQLAITFAAAFLLLTLLHVLEPEFDPSWRMISEYELGRFGWLMRLAFFCWSGSIVALFVTLRGMPLSGSGIVGRWWLPVLTAALIGAGIFATDPIIALTSSLPNRLHALCGAIVILTFPPTATLLASGLAKNPDWHSARRRLRWMTILTWVGLLAYFGSLIISRAINPDAGRVGPEIYQGWPNRFMVVTYHCWVIVIALAAARKTQGKFQ